MADFQCKLKVLELYSGIGGMHFALQASGVSYEVIQAVDINPAACIVYKHNFPQTKLTEGLIEGAVDVDKLEKLSVDMILMSPPCQPFTRMGKQKDLEDSRTNSFIYLLSLLPRLSNPPKYILVENVKGFETSQVRQTLIDTLQHCDYNFQEFLLTPLQFNVPNSRLRYYLIAKSKPLQFSFTQQIHVLLEIPECDGSQTTSHRLSKSEQNGQESYKSSNVDVQKCEKDISDKEICGPVLNSCETMCCASKDNKTATTLEIKGDNFPSSDHSNISVLNSSCDDNNISPKLLETTEELIEKDSQKLRQQHDEYHKPYPSCHKVQHYLEKNSSDYFHQFLLSDSDLKRFVIMDIVPPSAKKTACFARRYGNFIEGGGSVVMMTQDSQAVTGAADLKARREEMKQNTKEGWDEDSMAILRELQLRWFTPQEIANLLCFPPQFNFPEGLTLKQKYKCLGNSLNVRVVSKLIKLLVNNDLPN